MMLYASTLVAVQVRDRIGLAAAKDLVPLVGEHLLVDLERAAGKSTTLMDAFRQKTRGQWVGGDPRMDRSNLRVAQLHSPPLPLASRSASTQQQSALRPPSPQASASHTHSPPPAANSPSMLLETRWKDNSRAMLTFIATSQVIDLYHINQCLEYDPTLFERPLDLRDWLVDRRENCKLPRSIVALVGEIRKAGIAVATVPDDVHIPSTVSRAEQLRKPLTKLLTHKADVEKMMAICKEKERIFYRRRLQNHLVDHLLREEGTTGKGQPTWGLLVSLHKMKLDEAEKLLQTDRPSTFCRGFCSLKGAGPLVALKTAYMLQYLGYLKFDDAPTLGDSESAFCYLRVLASNVLSGRDDPTWLKATGRKRSGKVATVLRTRQERCLPCCRQRCRQPTISIPMFAGENGT